MVQAAGKPVSIGQLIGHRDCLCCAVLHEPIRPEAVDLSVGAAVDDEVCEYGANHRNELEAMAGEPEGVIATVRVGRGADHGQVVGGHTFYTRPGTHDPHPSYAWEEIGRRLRAFGEL